MAILSARFCRTWGFSSTFPSPLRYLIIMCSPICIGNHHWVTDHLSTLVKPNTCPTQGWVSFSSNWMLSLESGAALGAFHSVDGMTARFVNGWGGLLSLEHWELSTSGWMIPPRGRFLIRWKNLEHLELSSGGWMDGWMA
jgi:hypothetical protein